MPAAAAMQGRRFIGGFGALWRLLDGLVEVGDMVGCRAQGMAYGGRSDDAGGRGGRRGGMWRVGGSMGVSVALAIVYRWGK